jgi:Domain of unknown function (DUF4338)
VPAARWLDRLAAVAAVAASALDCQQPAFSHPAQWRQPNLASRILALNLKRLSADWELLYSHPILVAETFVDPARFQGTCYRAVGWRSLGTTRGFAKRGCDYVCHGQPKLVLVRPLCARAVSQLVAPSYLP